MACASGKRAPPPRPCSTRKAISMLSFEESAQRSEPMVKRARQSMKRRLMPKRLLK